MDSHTITDFVTILAISMLAAGALLLIIGVVAILLAEAGPKIKIGG